MKVLFLLMFPLWMFAQSVAIQILGSGGPEFSQRASSSYLIWVDGKARVLVDMGAGSFMRFSQSGADISDLQMVALTHLHIDHSADLPAFMKAGFFSSRRASLPIIGTVSGGGFPAIDTFLQRLFGTQGAFSYMQDILTPQSDSFQIIAQKHSSAKHTIMIGDIKVTTVGVNHGPVPALAYAFEIAGKKIVFSGDTSAQSDTLIALAKGADYLIAHHAVPEHGGAYARRLHMNPTRIGEVASRAGVKHLILSHRMKRTLGKEAESERLIRKSYHDDLVWAEDLMKIRLQ